MVEEDDKVTEDALTAPRLNARTFGVGRKWRWWPLFFMLPLFSFLYFYITTMPGKATLNHDEMWGATLANLSFFDAIIFTLRFDVHPPVYYAQLNLWALAGHSDKWLQANSVAWLLGTAIIAFYLIRKKYDELSATITAALILSSPMLIAYSITVRMYTFLCFMTLAGLAVSENILENVSARNAIGRKQYLVLFLLQAAVIYSHTTGIIIVAANCIYVLLEAWNLKASKRFFVRWILMYLALGSLALPAIANSFIRQVSHPVAPGLEDVLSSLTQLIVGTTFGDIGIGNLALFSILFLSFCAAATLSARSRNLILSYCVFPLIFGFVISNLLKPMWLTYVFLFCVPVAFVAIGYFIGELFKRFPHIRGTQFKSAIGICAAAIVLLNSIRGIDNAVSEKLPNYPVVVADLKRNAFPGDCVVALDTFDVFWGLSRYFVGTSWNEGLQIQAAPRQRWKTIMAVIPPGLARWLDLVPRSDRFDYGSIQIIDGYPTDIGASCRRAFFVGFSRDFEEVPSGVISAPVFAAYGPLIIRGPETLEETVHGKK